MKRVTYLRLLIATGLLGLTGFAAPAAPGSCEVLLSEGVKVTAPSGDLSRDNLQEALELTRNVAKVIYAEFEFPTGLETEFSERAKPLYSPFANLIRTPFDFATTFLRPTESRVAKYWAKHGRRFRGREIFVHELGHSFHFIAFSREIREFAEFYRLQTEFLLRYPFLFHLSKRGELDFGELAPGSSAFDEAQALMAQFNSRDLMRPAFLIKPYDELLADLAVALYFDEPRAFVKGDRLKWQAEDGCLAVLLLGWAHKPCKYRLFDTIYQSNIVQDLVTDHNLLGPARSYIWQLYLIHKDHVSKSRFMRLVYDAILIEIRERIAAKRYIDLRIAIHMKDRVISQNVDSEDFNDCLIARLLQIRWPR